MNTSPTWTGNHARLAGLFLSAEQWPPSSNYERWQWLVREYPHTDSRIAGDLASGHFTRTHGQTVLHARAEAQRQAEAAAWHYIINDPVLCLYLAGSADDIQAAYADVWPAPTGGGL